MPILEKTQIAMRRLSGDPSLRYGRHATSELVPGSSGVHAGEVAYEPGVHDPQDIDQYSMMGIALNIPQVAISRERGALVVKMIIDRASGQDDPAISQGRNSLVESLRDSIDRSKALRTDKVITYLIDDASEYDPRRNPRQGTTRIIDSSQGGDYVSNTVADVCRGGLTFIISNFEGLSLKSESETHFKRTIAIKANVPGELEFPPGVEILVGEGEDAEWLNTSKPKKLARYNAGLNKHHEKISASIELAGIALARTVIGLDSKFGFDVISTDAEIAAAIKQVTNR